MARPAWFIQLLKVVFPARSLIARLTQIPAIDKFIEHWLFESDDSIYLPMNEVIQINHAIQPSDEVVLPSRVVEHFIDSANVLWIMNNCICREANQCQNYPIDLGCLFLGEAAQGINPKLGRPVSKAEAHQHVERCRQAGLIHLIGRIKLDAVWLGVQPPTKLLTICHCCPCCCLWGVLPHMTSRMRAKIRPMPGIQVMVNHCCVGCGVCVEGVCFVDAISMVDGYAHINDRCLGCGRCITVCPEWAIELSILDSCFIHETVARISTLVDLA